MPCVAITILRAGSVMQSSKLPFLYWYKVMSQRDDDAYSIEGTFELDEGFFEQAISDADERERVAAEGPKRGRGSEQKAKVLVMVGSESVEGHNLDKHDKNRKCGFLKMKVIEDLKAETDDLTSYVGLERVLKEHHAHQVSKKEVCKALALGAYGYQQRQA